MKWAARSAPRVRRGSTATSTRARSSSRWCEPAGAPGTTDGGCPTSSSWAWASPSPTTTPRGPPSSASTPTSASPPATSPCPPSASCPGIRRLASEALPVNLAVSLHAADDALRDELVPINRRYPLVDADGRLLRLPARQGSPALVRVGAHRRRERPQRRRRRPHRAVPEPPAARPREPHPPEPHAGLRGAGHADVAGPGVPRPSTRGRRQRHRPPDPRHGDRRRVRAAPRHRTRQRARRHPPGCTESADEARWSGPSSTDAARTSDSPGRTVASGPHHAAVEGALHHGAVAHHALAAARGRFASR